MLLNCCVISNKLSPTPLELEPLYFKYVEEVNDYMGLLDKAFSYFEE